MTATVDPFPQAYVRPQTAQQAALQALRTAIITGAIPPGTPLVQDTLAEQLGVSRIPIREALKVLEAEEHVTYVPHVGFTVTKLDLHQLLEVFHLRSILEAEARRAGVPRVTPAVIEQMRDAMDRMELAATAADPVATVVQNRRFHFLPMQQAPLPRTLRMITQLWDTSDPHRRLYENRLNLDQINAEHGPILDAVAAGDVETTVRLSDQHRQHSIAHLRAALDA